MNLHVPITQFKKLSAHVSCNFIHTPTLFLKQIPVNKTFFG